MSDTFTYIMSLQDVPFGPVKVGRHHQEESPRDPKEENNMGATLGQVCANECKFRKEKLCTNNFSVCRRWIIWIICTRKSMIRVMTMDCRGPTLLRLGRNRWKYVTGDKMFSFSGRHSTQRSWSDRGRSRRQTSSNLGGGAILYFWSSTFSDHSKQVHLVQIILRWRSFPLRR